MHDTSAKTKQVRPFTPSLEKRAQDPEFTQWEKSYAHNISIEVGCGAGLHSIAWTKENPTHGLIAIERTQVKFKSFSQRALSHQHKNLFPVNQEALYWIPTHINPCSVDQYYFLFPNPYPKEKQANKRWHRAPFFSYILETLKPRGLVHFATNEEWYAKECLLYCQAHWKLSLKNKLSFTKSSNIQPRTHFERKYLSRGQTIYNLTFCKTEKLEK